MSVPRNSSEPLALCSSACRGSKSSAAQFEVLLIRCSASRWAAIQAAEHVVQGDRVGRDAVRAQVAQPRGSSWNRRACDETLRNARLQTILLRGARKGPSAGVAKTILREGVPRKEA